MSPRFWFGYCPSIATETWLIGPQRIPLYRIHANDADGQVMIGAQSFGSPSEAFWRLCEFIDGELARRLKTTNRQDSLL